ncbi:MAG: hypothetical protein CVV51_09635 [Spirochaetae bacterium HGW-Spirochaetae-7]|jgi:hypothetical protein|nr:MAG: hypothetical protein CVV51_09635 [Spirochaetae bacterium HGW-Spirochaetae-7]
MSKSGFDSSFAAAMAVVALAVAVAGFTSTYAAGQASAYFSQALDKAMGGPPRHSTWITLRDGYVLGRAEPKNGNVAYVIVARRPGGEYRVALNVDADGSVIKTTPLGASNGFPYARRLGLLFERTMTGGFSDDHSPLDVAIQPLVINAIESVARLERQRTEELK